MLPGVSLASLEGWLRSPFLLAAIVWPVVNFLLVDLSHVDQLQDKTR